METKTISIGFGALAPTIAQQLKTQGFKYSTDTVKQFEKLRECITHLLFSDLLNDKMHDKIKQKLFTQIRRHVMQKNKLKIA